MRNTGGCCIALLLVIAVILASFGNSHDNRFSAESPRVVCGDSASQSGTDEDGADDTARLIAFVVIVIIVIFIIYCITGSDNQSHEWR